MSIDKYQLIIELEKNIADEAEAREGYYRILKDYSEILDDQEIEQIENIIAEELKHSDLLHHMIYRRNLIAPEY